LYRIGERSATPRNVETEAIIIEVIARYTRPELGALWTDQARMETWRRVEVAACEELPALLGDGEGPLPSELEAIRGATFTVEAVNERERVTDHDVAAFVDVLSASAGEAGRWIHFGLTSSDVLDTALALQLRAAGEIVVPGARALVQALANRAREHVDTLCVGRTHGVQAEPTTFGVKLAGFAFEAHRNALRLQAAFEQTAIGAISGAVGTYAATSPDFERRVLERLGLRREDVSTQVVARDRHAQLLSAIALAGAGLERLATEIRHLQRTEVREVREPFREGQKGSSAMPHKRNPIKSEQITGLARVLRGNAQAGLENVALWHERDISHSSVERVILPDSTTLLDHMQRSATALVQGMVVDEARMRTNLESTHGALYSQRVLLALVEGDAPAGRPGMARDDAYRIAQELAQRAWDEGTQLRDLLAADERTAGLDLDAIFDPAHFTRYAGEIVGRLDEIA
jgi:adenylosuccinate lyase